MHSHRSFSHVLGLDDDALLILAAKELKQHGELRYRVQPAGEPPPPPQAAADVTAAALPGGDDAASDEDSALRIARVSDRVDRDRVRFWTTPLPELPPKLAPVDAVLIEDVEGRLGAPGLRRVLEQVPALLNPKGVCAVVLGDTETSGAALAAAGEQLQSAGLTCVVHTDANYSLPGDARVGVWEQR